jgi:hypothetical protein
MQHEIFFGGGICEKSIPRPREFRDQYPRVALAREALPYQKGNSHDSKLNI